MNNPPDKNQPSQGYHCLAVRRALQRHLESVSQANDGGMGVPNRFRRLIDWGVDTMPEAYRVPVILCDLEGRTIQEAARMLGWSSRQVRTGLHHGRQLLHGRLQSWGAKLSLEHLVAWLHEEGKAALRPLTDTRVKRMTAVVTGQDSLSQRVAGLVHWVLHGGK